MKTLLIFLFLFSAARDSNCIELHRNFDVVPFFGALTTRNFLTTPDQTQIISGMTIQISVFSHGGYFVEGFIGPTQRQDFQIFTRPDGTFNIWGYTDSFLAVLSAGPFVKFDIKSVDVSYRIGYAAAGDGWRGSELLIHGITLTRLFQEAWVTRLDVRQFSKSWHSVGVSYSIGLGRRF